MVIARELFFDKKRDDRIMSSIARATISIMMEDEKKKRGCGRGKVGRLL